MDAPRRAAAPLLLVALVGGGCAAQPPPNEPPRQTTLRFVLDKITLPTSEADFAYDLVTEGGAAPKNGFARWLSTLRKYDLAREDSADLLSAGVIDIAAELTTSDPTLQEDDAATLRLSSPHPIGTPQSLVLPARIHAGRVETVHPRRLGVPRPSFVFPIPMLRYRGASGLFLYAVAITLEREPSGALSGGFHGAFIAWDGMGEDVGLAIERAGAEQRTLLLSFDTNGDNQLWSDEVWRSRLMAGAEPDIALAYDVDRPTIPGARPNALSVGLGVRLIPCAQGTLPPARPRRSLRRRRHRRRRDRLGLRRQPLPPVRPRPLLRRRRLCQHRLRARRRWPRPSLCAGALRRRTTQRPRERRRLRRAVRPLRARLALHARLRLRDGAGLSPTGVPVTRLAPAGLSRGAAGRRTGPARSPAPRRPPASRRASAPPAGAARPASARRSWRRARRRAPCRPGADR